MHHLLAKLLHPSRPCGSRQRVRPHVLEPACGFTRREPVDRRPQASKKRRQRFSGRRLNSQLVDRRDADRRLAQTRWVSP